jgi:hypothetical protein
LEILSGHHSFGELDELVFDNSLGNPSRRVSEQATPIATNREAERAK